MLIDFDKTEAKRLDSFKGGEKYALMKIIDDGFNKIMHGVLIPGASIGLHRHEGNSEIIYIIKGQGKVLYNGEYEPLTAGSVHYCPMGQEHSLINDSGGELEFFAVVPEHRK